MEAVKCKTCQHFHQHYILDRQSCRAVNCGHCTHPGLKHRKPEQPACSLYAPGTGPDLPDRLEVIHYLTVDLLQYILQLELPPEEIS